MDTEQLDQAVLATLHGKIDRINDNIDAVKEKQEEILNTSLKLKRLSIIPTLVFMLACGP